MAALPQQNRISQSSNGGATYRVLRTAFGDGYSQRLQDGLNSKVRRWNVAWDNVTQAEYESIITALDTAGGVDYLTWTPPGQAAGKWIAADISISTLSGELYNVSAALEEVFDL